MLQKLSSKDVKVVFSGGGIPGILGHSGAVMALKDLEYNITDVGGVSAGALVAAAVARGIEPKVVMDTLTQRLEISPNLSLSALGRSPAFLKSNVREILSDLFPGTIDDVNIPLHVVTANIATKHQMIWASTVHEGKGLADILYSSMCIPFVFKPIKLGQYVHVDGGLTSNVPATDIFGDRSDVLVFVTERQGSEDENPKSVTDFAVAVLNTAMKNNSRQDMIDLTKGTIIPVSVYGPTIQYKVKETYAKNVIRWGYQSAVEGLRG